MPKLHAARRMKFAAAMQIKDTIDGIEHIDAIHFANRFDDPIAMRFIFGFDRNFAQRIGFTTA
jgi:hypothetical protein